MMGTTPQEQKGESAPNTAATTMTRACRPLKTRAICRSTPEAFALAATNTESPRKGAINASAFAVKIMVSSACAGMVNASSATTAMAASSTRSMWRTRRVKASASVCEVTALHPR